MRVQVSPVNAATDSAAPARSSRPGASAAPVVRDAGISQCPATTDSEDPKAFLTAQLIWQQMHGIVSLRISRSTFPWPSLEHTVRTAVGALLDAARP